MCHVSLYRMHVILWNSATLHIFFFLSQNKHLKLTALISMRDSHRSCSQIHIKGVSRVKVFLPNTLRKTHVHNHSSLDNPSVSEMCYVDSLDLDTEIERMHFWKAFWTEMAQMISPETSNNSDCLFFRSYYEISLQCVAC